MYNVCAAYVQCMCGSFYLSDPKQNQEPAKEPDPKTRNRNPAIKRKDPKKERIQSPQKKK